MGNSYDWFRAIHIIAVIAWCGLLISALSFIGWKREMIVSRAAMDKAAASNRKIILNPTMIIVWLMGLALIGSNWQFYVTQVWFWGKIVLVL